MKRIILFVLGLCTFLNVACNDSGKVTDPGNPGFNPEKFRFEDYPSASLLAETLQKLFPVGTPKEEVNQILIGYGGAYETVPFFYNEQAKVFGKAADGYFLLYYKPKNPAGDYGWDKTSSGWVLKISYTPDDKYKDGKVLTLPQKNGVFAANPFVIEAQTDLLMKLDLERQKK